MNYERVQKLLRQLQPLTLPYLDFRGNHLQIWKTNNEMFGVVMDLKGNLTIISKEKIRNPLCYDNRNLSYQLEHIGLRPWDIVFDYKNKELILWPHLSAAGKEDQEKLDKIFGKVDRSNLEKLNKKLRHLERKQNEFIRKEKLANGSTLYIEKEKPAKKEGRVRGCSYATEYNPKTARVKSWMISYDHSGKPVMVHKKYENGRDISKDIRSHYPLTAKDKEGGLKQIFADKHFLEILQKSTISGKTPANKNFEQRLQQTKLTDSYNSTHRQNPVQAKAGTGGEIGGVACSTDYIEGLFDSVESLFEQDNFFCLPKLPDGKMPFSDNELKQILRELAIGIYAHSTIPFFSLHFNQNSDQFPVIHPAYENTLVGRVIGLLDYFMKGYLNGSVGSVTYSL
jgi:hypothetical protein